MYLLVVSNIYASISSHSPLIALVWNSSKRSIYVNFTYFVLKYIELEIPFYVSACLFVACIRFIIKIQWIHICWRKEKHFTTSYGFSFVDFICVFFCNHIFFIFYVYSNGNVQSIATAKRKQQRYDSQRTLKSRRYWERRGGFSSVVFFTKFHFIKILRIWKSTTDEFVYFENENLLFFVNGKRWRGEGWLNPWAPFQCVGVFFLIICEWLEYFINFIHRFLKCTRAHKESTRRRCQKIHYTFRNDIRFIIFIRIVILLTYFSEKCSTSTICSFSLCQLFCTAVSWFSPIFSANVVYFPSPWFPYTISILFNFRDVYIDHNILEYSGKKMNTTRRKNGKKETKIEPIFRLVLLFFC